MTKISSIFLASCCSILATACLGGPAPNTFYSSNSTGDSRDAVAGWKCNTSGGGTQTSKDGRYYATSFGCWLDADGKHRGDGADNCIPYCIDTVCGDKGGRDCEEDIKWFTAGERRWGCGTRLQVTDPANGKSVVVMVIDRGPSCSIEKQAKFWAADLSYPTTAYLFGEEKGISDKAVVQVEVVAAGTALGPVSSSNPAPEPEPQESSASGCGAVTYEGSCVGDTVQWCEADVVRTLDCSDSGKQCGLNQAQGYYDCLAGSAQTAGQGGAAGGSGAAGGGNEQAEGGSGGSAEPSACGDVTYEGQCVGDTVEYCEAGAIQTIDCSAGGGTCGWNDSSDVYDCLPGSQGSGGSQGDGGSSGNQGCGPVTSEGTCDGTVLQYCDGGTLATVDCATWSLSCGWDYGNGYYNCL